jgi:hypothetical protein
MKDKLINCWNELNSDRYTVEPGFLFPIMRDMDRIALVLAKRYNFIVSF